MAGVRQHYIPRFLQAGFAARSENDAIFTWVFRRDREPYEGNSRHTGVERHFYTEGKDTEVDDAITQIEGDFSALTARLRVAPAGPIHESNLPRFLAHLEVRSRHLRETFRTSADYVLDRILTLMADENAFIDLLQKRMSRDPAWFRGLLVEELKKRDLTAGRSNALLDAYWPAIETHMPQLLADFRPAIRATVQSVRSILPEAVKRAVKDGHIKALKRSLHPPLRTELLSGLDYRLVELSPSPFVLGDSAVLFRVGGSRPFRPFVDKGDDLQATFLPLTPSRILVGERGRSEWDWSLIRRQLARCSLEHFIAHEDSPELRALQQEIGQDAFIMTPDELDAIAIESFQSMGQPAVSRPAG